MSFPRKARIQSPRHARPSLDARIRGHDTDVSESSPDSLGRAGSSAASLSLEGLAVLLDEGLQRHGRTGADRLDQVVGAGEDAGLEVERHLADVLEDE